ncbi:hypothetical protein DID88_000349 [Monilinia fructigena]|uniref:Uncharacterized protein n=1 Tax=Monilinia fructigena TaxID=38457 RepID=A0A395IH92_9HELO|nr:hypothetical protein DID88_000349 [Monilinia fructigena]
MRRTLRQFAAVKPARYLEPNTPTGLTGLNTHRSPRSALLYLYSSTLDNVVPVGYEEWAAKAKETMAAHPEVFSTPEGGIHSMKEGRYVKVNAGGKVFVQTKIDKEVDWKLRRSRIKIGAGLIEEVIQVAEGELTLTNVLLKARVWEDLGEACEGQWTYFKRDTATPTTQSPPSKVMIPIQNAYKIRRQRMYSRRVSFGAGLASVESPGLMSINPDGGGGAPLGCSCGGGGGGLGLLLPI